MTTNYQGPLAGVNVIDLGHYYAGPMAAMLLADQGANVIRIVRPGDTELPEQQYRLLNRNKKLLTLDLKTSEDKAQAESLIENADVLIENFRPGVMKRLGLDYLSVKENNPGLVYLSLPGFASTDKERAHIQAWEGVLGAAAGIYRNTSYVREYLNFPPVYSPVPVNSMFGGVQGATAVMAALLAREAHGYGTVIEVSLAEAGMSAFGFKFCFSPFLLDRTLQFRNPDSQTAKVVWEEQSINCFSPSDLPEQSIQKLANSLRAFWPDPLYQYHRCAGGRHIKMACWGGVSAERFLKALGIYQQLLSEGFVNVSPHNIGKQPCDILLDNNISNFQQMSDPRKQRLRQMISEAFLAKTAEQWDAELGEQVASAMVRTRDEYLALEPMMASGVLTHLDDGQSILTVPGRFVDVTGPEDKLINTYEEAEFISAAQADALFEHKEIGKVVQGERPRQNKGDLLNGLKVLEISNGIAGPMCGYLLAQYGADIIKLEHPDSKGIQALMVEVNQGKRSILTDLKTAPGQEILQRLVSTVNVLVNNKLDPIAERLGISHTQLKSINPGIVSCQISACGGTWRGGWERRYGFDPIAQAITGLLIEYGSLEEPHDHEGTMIADSMCGYGMAFGALLGVWQKCKTGYAGEVRTSLLGASNFIQLPHMIAEHGSRYQVEASGQFALGEHPWQRMYECEDGWIYVAATKERASQLAVAITGRQVVDERSLEAAFSSLSCADCLFKLNEISIACHRVLSVDDICSENIRRVDNQATDEIAPGAGEILCWENHPCGSPVVLQAPDWVRIGEAYSWKRLHPAPAYGEQSLSILREIGYSEETIKRLSDLGVIA